MIDSLGDRMKKAYEYRTSFSLPRRTYIIIRVDGKSFHTYTRGLKKPFDDGLMEDLDSTAAYLCQNIMGAKFAFIQSDEISLLLTDFNNIGTEAWFDNNVQKMSSVSASMATAVFNQLRLERVLLNFYENRMRWAQFDSRVFQIPNKTEVENYFIWRQQDATRNSISSVAQSLYSHKELKGVDSNGKQEFIFQKGINWNDYSSRYKRGRIVSKKVCKKLICTTEDKDKIEQIKKSNDNWYTENNEFGVTVKTWKVSEVPVFTQKREFLSLLVPNNHE